MHRAVIAYLLAAYVPDWIVWFVGPSRRFTESGHARISSRKAWLTESKPEHTKFTLVKVVIGTYELLALMDLAAGTSDQPE